MTHFTNYDVILLRSEFRILSKNLPKFIFFRKLVKEHEAQLNNKLEWLKREAKDLAKKRKSFIELKEKADQLDDPHVHAGTSKMAYQL